jgi:hypothetical protein
MYLAVYLGLTAVDVDYGSMADYMDYMDYTDYTFTRGNFGAAIHV